MPFGLASAPAVFQALVNYLLRDMFNLFVFVYQQDILIFSPHRETHVRQVLMKLLENQLFVKAEKYHVLSTTFLSFIIAKIEGKMDPSKVQAVAEWPVPV